MATSTSAFPLATEQPHTQEPDPPGAGQNGNAAGASGSSPGVVEISRGALIAIIVVVAVVAIMGSKLRVSSDS